MNEVMTQEKIIDKIRKLLNLADESRNNSEGEAIAAAMRAQALMAKYNIDIKQVEIDDKSSREITQEEIWFTKNAGYNIRWRFTLANIVSRNFRVKYFTRNKDRVVFYGYKSDVEIAASVFNYLFATGNRLSLRYYYDLQKQGRPTRGAMNEYLIGFCKGLQDVLEKQCVALAIVTPKEVEESYKEMSKDWKSFNANVGNRSYSHDAFNKGRSDGKHAANSRSIEGEVAC